MPVETRRRVDLLSLELLSDVSACPELWISTKAINALKSSLTFFICYFTYQCFWNLVKFCWVKEIMDGKTM